MIDKKMTQHEVITQIRDAMTTGDYGLAVRALNEYKEFVISRVFVPTEWTAEDISEAANEKSLNKQ